MNSKIYLTKKQKLLTGNNQISDSEDDVDEHGNIKDLIDYDYDEDNEEDYEEESESEDHKTSDEEENEYFDEDFLDEDDIDDEDILAGKLLSKYINDKMGKKIVHKKKILSMILF